MNHCNFHAVKNPVWAISVLNFAYLTGKQTENLNVKAWMAACYKRRAAANWLLNYYFTEIHATILVLKAKYFQVCEQLVT